MFDNYPPGVAPANTPNTKPVVDIYAGLSSQSPAQPTPPMATMPSMPSMPNQLPNQNPYADLETMNQQQGGGSLKFLAIGLVTLVVVLVGAVLVYQMVLKPKFSNLEPMPELVSEIEQISEDGFEDLPVVSSTDSSETEIIYATSSASGVTSSLNMPAVETGTSTVTTTELTEVDTDKDQLSDDMELLRGTNKNLPDTDGDGLMDGEEVNMHQTDPSKIDTDGDGLTDSEEVDNYRTKPLIADTDGDGFSDGQEVKNNYNPLGAGRLMVPKR